MIALYSTDPVLILGTRWAHLIDAKTGRGGFYWQDGTMRHYLPFDAYNHRTHGLVTLAELHAAILEPNREAITKARKAIDARPAYQLTPPPSAMQFNLI